ncbi:hypothetical protein HJFPF1_12791 [Paramyrothecium foliicola]|nr:hypothetical protein HJFPF1_12791 [Paramyrothecium foliicola]
MLASAVTAALPLLAATLSQAFIISPGVGNGIWTFEEQADGSFLTKREVEVEETFAFNNTVSLKHAKRDEQDDKDKQPKIPEPILKNYPVDWETVPLPHPKQLNCPERRSKIRQDDYKAAVSMLEHFCKYYYVQQRSNAAFVSGGAIVYVCNRHKKGGICSVGEYTSAENDMNKECLAEYPAWARYDKNLNKIYGRDIIGNPFCQSDDQVLKHDLHKPNDQNKKDD